MQDFLSKNRIDFINKPYLLALNRIPRVGPRTIMKLLNRWPLLKEMFCMTALQLESEGLPSCLARAIEQVQWVEVEKDLSWQACPNHFLLTWCDESYPKLLLEIPDPPAVLYAIGDLSCLLQTSISIVGTRKPSVTGRETAFRFAQQLAQYSITIVSGLALGIDGAAHSGCLEGMGKTIAVMGSGIDRVYPYQHMALAEKICQNGLLLSEFPLKTSPIAGHFPRRNRIISGLSSAILVVEAAIKSGSLITARLALEQNRDVLAIPSSIHNPQATGCHYLLQQGAKLVASVHDILEELKLECFAPEVSKTKEVLACGNQNLVKCIGFEVTTIDQIMERGQFSIEEVMCCLANLELQGVIKAVSGGYMRCI